MSYPPAPWKATGFVLNTFRLIDIETARRFVPPELEIVSVLPGKTLATVYLAEYGPGSALEYSELIVSPALTRHGSTFRFWISHIYVDNHDSLMGGWEIWGLPKEMAQFAWSQDRREVEVRQGERLLCRLVTHKLRWLLPMLILLPTFGILGSDLLSFMVSISGRLGITGSHLEVPADSPFAALGLAGQGRALSLKNIHFVAGAPRIIINLRQQLDNAKSQKLV